MARKKRNAPAEVVSGRYVPIPHSLLNCDAFQASDHMAKALLFELIAQHNGSNNGHIRLSRNWLAGRGWTSVSSIVTARDELLRNRLIVQTRHGGLRNGPHMYALSWLAITNFKGLDLAGPHEYHVGGYLLPPPQKNGCPPHSLRNAAARPPHSLSENALRPPHRPETALFDGSPRPPHGRKLKEPLRPVVSSALGSVLPADAQATADDGELL
jgi:hypothetical protein